MCNHLLRFQEYYESPKFQNEIFTIGQFKKWYSDFYGIFDYYDIVEGMNIPSSVLKCFIEGWFDPLTENETKIIDLFGHRSTSFYIIATAENSSSDIYDHELLHALYGTNIHYKSSIDTLFKNYTLKDLEKYLYYLGYSKKVMLDECHAYIGACSEFLLREGVKFPKELVIKIQLLKNEYLK